MSRGIALLGVAPRSQVDLRWLRRRRLQLVLAFHPDHHPGGGDPDAMQAVLDAVAQIERDGGRVPDVYRVEATALGARVVLE